MQEAKFTAQLNLRVRESDKRELKTLSEKLDVSPTVLGRLAFRRGLTAVREHGIMLREESAIDQCLK